MHPRLINWAKYPLLISLLFLGLLVASTGSLMAKETPSPLQIVTSFSILQDITQNLAGEQAQVYALVDANSDAHVYQPKPSDAKLLATADLVIENGLGFEGWLSRLLASSGFKGKKLVATQDLTPLYRANNPSRPDPHAWHSFTAIKVYIDNISAGLISLRPEQEAYFLQQKAAYLAQLEQLETELKTALTAAIGQHQAQFLVPHAAFAYLEADFNLKLLAPQGISTASEPSAKQLAQLLTQLKDQQIQGIFTENLSNSRFMHTLSQASGIKIAGLLYSDSLSATKEPAGSYLLFMQHNIKMLINALK